MRFNFGFRLFLATIFLTSNSSFSFSFQKSDSANRKVQTYYDKDKKVIKEKYQIKKTGNNTYKDGLYQIFFESGKLWQAGNYKNDSLYGIWDIYYANGQLKQTLNYLHGLRTGESKIYYDDGNLYQEIFYKNDL